MTAVTSGSMASSLTDIVDQRGERPRVLLVDDEPAVTAALKRQLHGRYLVDTANDPREGLAKAESAEGLAIVVSDMRMPGMNGAEFLRRVRECKPDAVRILLTGFSEVEAAVAAVNEGQIFRFLSKPIPPQALLSCLEEAARQYRLVTAERELLEQTLRASVKALMETLSIANPMAFSRAERITRRLMELAKAEDAPNLWEIEVAGMLAHIGAITLPRAVTDRVHAGDRLTVPEQDLVDRLPQTALSVLEGIPRLEGVREIIRFQVQQFDGCGRAQAGLAGKAIPLGARMLRLVTDFDTLEARGLLVPEILRRLEKERGVYDPSLLEAVGRLTQADNSQRSAEHLSLADLRPGMVLAADMCSVQGRLYCGRGQQLTARLLEILHTWARESPVQEPIVVEQGL